MRKVTGDTAALVAATLVQAEMTTRAPAQMTRQKRAASIARAYEYYLTLVTTGEIPPEDAEAG